MTIMQTMQEWEAELFDVVKRVEDPLVRFGHDMAEFLADYTPEQPEWPFASQLPSVGELVDFQIEFAHRMVDTQATFTREMVKAWKPVIAKLEPKPAPARKVRSAAKAA